MVPALCALSGCSIFIASSTTTRSPASTSAPSSTATFTMVPCIGEVRESPEAAAPLRFPLPRFGALTGPAAPRPAGIVTSKRFPPTSTTSVTRGAASSPTSAEPLNGGMSLSNSVSIQRLCTRNGSAVKAGSSTTLRWNGSSVASPSTCISESARAARCSACSRVDPVTISLASSESKAPPMTSPELTPESTRTPGPEGATKLVTMPGAGRKPRPGSSPLMRNSKLCPRGSGSPNPSASPSAIRNCSRTRSMPATSSVTGCSTCSRVFTSRKLISPSAPTRNSQVPAPT